MKKLEDMHIWKLNVFILLLLHFAISLLAVTAGLYYIYFHFCLRLECVTSNSLNDKKAEKGKGVVSPQMAQ